jgi:hypothetical protein
MTIQGTPSEQEEASSPPNRTGLLLPPLILVAAVANPNLAVAKVALSSIRAAFNAVNRITDDLSTERISHWCGPDRPPSR